MNPEEQIATSWRDQARALQVNTESVVSEKETKEGAAAQDTIADLDGTPFSLYYGQLQHQQNMLQDTVRTGTYQAAFKRNAVDFSESTVLDVGTGTGLLAFFAVQAGAQKVYGVEQASRMATLARRLVAGNKQEGKIEIIENSVEKTEIGQKVDIIVSEPIGFLLVHERMLESYIAARDLHLKEGGLMMPSNSTIYVAPITDAALHHEQLCKSEFWRCQNFYGIDLSALTEDASEEYIGQAVVGYFGTECLISTDRSSHNVDFHTVTLPELQSFDIPLHFQIGTTAIMHGLGCWFDVNFVGSSAVVTLSTAPDQPGTHWYQCRLLLKDPIAVNARQSVSGNLHFVATSKISYTITMTLSLDGTDIESTTKINLQDQYYHYLNPSVASYDSTYANYYGQSQQQNLGADLQDPSTLPVPPY